MHTKRIHESRNLKQARSKDQYVDLLRMGYYACYSLIFLLYHNKDDMSIEKSTFLQGGTNEPVLIAYLIIN